MNKICTLVWLCTMTCFSLSAQWNYVGQPAFSAGPSDYNSLAFDHHGNAFIAYQDVANNGEFSVQTFNDTGWAYVGSPSWSQSGGEAYQVRLAMDSGGTPYVFCTDNNYGVVRKYDSSNWVFVGDSQFTQITPDYLAITIAPNGTPYVMFSDFDSNEMAMVMKFNGQQWDTVGNYFLSYDQALYDGIATDANSNPYIVFSDNSEQLKATVMEFTGTAWDTLGPRGFTSHAANYTSIAINHNNTPYIAYVDDSTNQANVLMYTGGNWVLAGNANFSVPNITGLLIAIDNNNIPYVAFNDTDGNQATVMSLTGGSWNYVGSPNFTSADAPYLSLAISPTTNIPYVAYTDAGNNEGLSVMGYGSTLGITEPGLISTVQLYPNPASDLIHLNTSDFTPEILSIFDMNGRQVIAGKYYPQMDVSALSRGIYFVEVKSNSSAMRLRFVKM